MARKKQSSEAEKPGPVMPENFDGEQVLEFQRVCEELAVLDLLNKVDRALIVLYVQTWAINQQASRRLEFDGPVCEYPNGMEGPSPYYKIARETSNALTKMLHQLGLTPHARSFKTKTAPTDLEL